jgi:fucose permease
MSTLDVAIPGVSRQRALFAILCGGFVLTGTAISILGPMLPVFIARWALDDAKAGLFSSVAFGASLVGVWLSSLVTSYFNYRPSIVTGYIAMSGGLIGLTAPSYAVALAAAVAIGLGYGMAVPGTNLSVAEMGGARNAGLVSLVNLAWGIGALSCSPLLLLALRLHSLQQMLVGVAAFGVLLTLALVFAAVPMEHRTGSTSAVETLPKLSVMVTVGLAALFFIYVGTEVSFSFWAATYVKRLRVGAQELSTVAPMFFFGGLISGRALTPIVLNRARESWLALGALCLVITGGSLLLMSKTQEMAFVSLAVTGLGCSCLFPINVAWLSRWYGKGAKKVSALMFSMASIGASAVPGFVGFLSDHAGGLRVGLLVPLGCAVLMILLLILLRKQTATG